MQICLPWNSIDPFIKFRKTSPSSHCRYFLCFIPYNIEQATIREIMQNCLPWNSINPFIQSRKTSPLSHCRYFLCFVPYNIDQVLISGHNKGDNAELSRLEQH